MGPGGESEWRRRGEGEGKWGGGVPRAEGNTKRPGVTGRRGRNGGRANEVGGIIKSDLADAGWRENAW